MEGTLHVNRSEYKKIGADQWMLQDPGPRGSPQAPHGPVTAFESDALPVLTAKTESCLSSS
jgi:hypothetical protein